MTLQEFWADTYGRAEWERTSILARARTLVARPASSKHIVSFIDAIPGPFIVHEAIPVAIEQIAPREYVACIVDANIAMSGDSPADAVEGLREHIASLYAALSRENKLGPGPKKQLEILGGHIGEKRGKSTPASRG
jgi:hypothetical protein